MSFRLTSADSKTKDQFAKALRDKWADVEAAQVDAENIINNAIDKMNEALHLYNEVAADAKAFVEEHASDWRNEYDEKSEKWQEGEKGQSASTFVEEWEGLTIEEYDDVEAAVPELPGDCHADDLDALPSEAES